MAYIPNFRWTVADMDRLEIARKWRHKTAEEISVIISHTAPHLICTTGRIREICTHHRLRLASEEKRA